MMMSSTVRSSPISVLDFNQDNVARYRDSVQPSMFQDEQSEGSSTWGGKTLVTHASPLHPMTMFAKEYTSALPYVEVKSRKFYDYSAVLMDEEHILGLRVRHLIFSLLIACE